jgi:hypothetical protein
MACRSTQASHLQSQRLIFDLLEFLPELLPQPASTCS